jgi:hypothetical protein
MMYIVIQPVLPYNSPNFHSLLLRGEVLVAGAECQGGGAPRGRRAKGRSAKGAKRQGGEAPGGEAPRGAKRHGTMESSRGHRASRSDDGGELERSDEGWLDDGASVGTPC